MLHYYTFWKYKNKQQPSLNHKLLPWQAGSTNISHIKLLKPKLYQFITVETVNIQTQTEPTIPKSNPLDFMTVTTNLSLTEDLKKKDTS